MFRFVIFFLSALAYAADAIDTDKLQLPLYDALFTEEFSKGFAVISHSESNKVSHYSIAGKLGNDDHKMHIAFGPEYGLVLRFAQAKSNLDGNGGSHFLLPGFAWDTDYNAADYGLKTKDANLLLHSRRLYEIKHIQVVPYGGLNYYFLNEKANKDSTKRDTELFYLPVGLAMMPNNDLVLQVAVSRMLWGDVRVDNYHPEVNNGYGLMLGVLWHKTKSTDCYADFNIKKYNVKDDGFVINQDHQTNINNLSSWNMQCKMSL